ncbi:LIM-domain binding protein/SEUSS [Parasponia andersonii]|uniref:LIM-domain binding protein/SEUSS n=1 Tax=Parasponia andersonii TaxID=3476 RepID=A0A2P5CBJ1_PARAD|nr:LIM-domain binding protein/SEUSS [Parasponia andersonii]
MKMALEAFLNSNNHLAATSAGLLQSSSSDNSFEEHGQYQAGVASPFNASTGNLPIPNRTGNANVGTVPLDIRNTNQIIGSYSRASSLVTDSNFAFSEGPNMHRSVSASMGSDFGLLSSPALFSAHDLRVSGSSIENGAFTAQQTSHLAPNKPQVSKKKQQQKGLTLGSRPGSQKLQSSPLCAVKQEPINITQRQKKPRLDFREEAIPDQYISRQLRLTPNTVQSPRHNTPQLSGLIQHQNSNQLNVLHAVAQLNGVVIQPQQQQLRNQLQHQVVQNRISNDHQVDEGACTLQLMQYMRHKRHRPPDNSLSYWRKFVAEYFVPGAKKRWCFSLYDKVGPETVGVSPYTAQGLWQCDVCCCRSGRGFEACFEVLPRLNKLKYENGVTDELFFLDCPQKYRFPSGLTMLKYGKAIQENVFEKVRVVFEGQLCVVFNHDLKILSWEFCAISHEVFVPQSLVASQTVKAAQRYPSSINDRALHGVLPQGPQTNCNQIQDAGTWLANAFDLQLVDDWGFSRRCTRFLQLAEMFDSLKDLMTLSLANGTGPVESLKNYCQEISISKFQTGGLQQKKCLECRDLLPTDNLMHVFPLVSTNVNDGTTRGRFVTNAEQEAAIPSYNQRLGPKTSISGLNNNFTANGMSSSARCCLTAEQLTIQKILQELINSRAVDEVEGQVPNIPYDSKEVAAALENLLG